MFVRWAAFSMVSTMFVLTAHWIVVLANRSARQRLQLRWWQRVSAELPLVGVLAGVFTAFVPLWKGQELRGWWLLAHVAVSPVLLVGLVAAAVFLAGRFGVIPVGREAEQRGDAGDAGGLARPGGSESHEAAASAGGAKTASAPTLAHRASYWLMLTLGVVAAGSVLLTMLPFAGQSCMNDLLAVHRYSSVALVMVTLWFGYLSVTRR